MKNEYFMGCDVSKGYADFIILDKSKRCIERAFQLDDTFAGHNCLCEKLHRFFSDHPESRLYAGVESTGGYENNWYQAMNQFQGIFDIKVARLNPCGVHASSRADLKRTITDAVSAKTIAEYLIAYLTENEGWQPGAVKVQIGEITLEAGDRTEEGERERLIAKIKARRAKLSE